MNDDPRQVQKIIIKDLFGRIRLVKDFANACLKEEKGCERTNRNQEIPDEDIGDVAVEGSHLEPSLAFIGVQGYRRINSGAAIFMADTSQETSPSNDIPSPDSGGSGKNPKSTKKWILENVLSLGLALLIVFMVRSSVVEAFKIPSGSMIPTLLIGDHIFVNKFAYGFKIPFSDLMADTPVYVVKREPPKRGDIIVFRFPKDDTQTLYYIKRVIGIPGDTVEIRDKALYVNQKAVLRETAAAEPAQKIFKSLDDPKYSSSNLDLFKEKIDLSEHFIMLDKNSFLNESFGPITVPPENLFVMGDNRDFSNDSRFWGYVPYNNVKGKAMVIWLSLWVSFSDSQFVFRPERIGTVLH